ncbi:MAG TPA: hypothetical protein VJT73_02445 [Polyangiaceae bacterium]|nr:hypothetical protein [Polyangiaceae bacterium]
MGPRTLTSPARIARPCRTLRALISLLAFAARARADLPASWERATTIAVPLLPCPAKVFDAAAFARLLEIELLTEHLRVERQTDSNPDVIRLGISDAICSIEPESVVAISIRMGAEEDVIEQSVSLAELGSGARERTLALALAEMLRHARHRELTEAAPQVPLLVAPDPASALADGPPNGAASTPPPAAPTAIASLASNVEALAPSARVIPEPPTRKAVTATFAWRRFVLMRTSFLGGGLAWEPPVLRTRSRLRLDAAALFSEANDPLGTLRLSHYAAGVAIFMTTAGTPTFLLGPRVEFGYVRVNASPARDGVTTHAGGHAIVLASLLAALRLPLTTRWSASVEAEFGVALVGLTVYASDRTVADLREAFASARVGWGFEF